MAVRIEGNWESWLEFFLRGVAETADEATSTATAIVRLKESHRQILQQGGLGPNHLKLLDLLFLRPLVNVSLVQARLDISDVTASRLINSLVSLGLVEEITGRKRNRIFRYNDYWRLFQPDNAP
jgi:Fic family protein